jgi:hypothetical protein
MAVGGAGGENAEKSKAAAASERRAGYVRAACARPPTPARPSLATLKRETRIHLRQGGTVKA